MYLQISDELITGFFMFKIAHIAKVSAFLGKYKLNIQESNFIYK